jgi:predicted ATPase
MKMKLNSIELKGFKSIDGAVGQTIPIGDVTVLLGANGSGKSNLVSFFKMLGAMTTQNLQQYVGRYGAQRLLFFGAKKTEEIWFKLKFSSEETEETYEVKLAYNTQQQLFVSSEKVTRLERELAPYIGEISSSAMESSLEKTGELAGREVFELLSKTRVYQFHDTSDTARMKERGYTDDSAYLRSDAGNLAAYLRRLKLTEAHKKYYDRILRCVQRIMPQLRDFELTPTPGNKYDVMLNWIDTLGSDYLFGPDQISDGSLRFIALATVLLQPPELLPRLIVLDEPELGLHPAALAELSGMVRTAAANSQVVIATQSTRLVDEFSPEQLVVVERDEQKHCSVFKKLDTAQLSDWLLRYSISELWEKNVLGGRP